MRRGWLGVGIPRAFFMLGWRRRGFGALALVALCGCSSGAKSQSAEQGPEIEECTAYLATYQRCIGRLAPQGENDARIAATRTRFTPPVGEIERESQRSACVTGLRQLSAACN